MADKRYIRLHRLEPASRANGPGLRAVIWFQGCTLGCPGCFNPLTHPHTGGRKVAVDQVVAEICAIDQPIEGVTISGGEPFQQPAALLELLVQIKQRSQLNVILFTGYIWEELDGIASAKIALTYVDILIAGRYEEKHRQAASLSGSTNKTTHFLTRCYAQSDLDSLPSAEVIIDSDGIISLTGIDPLKL